MKKTNLKVVKDETRKIALAAEGQVLVINEHQHRIDSIDSVIGVYPLSQQDKINLNDGSNYAFKIWVRNIFYQYTYSSSKDAEVDCQKVLYFWYGYLKGITQ